MKSRREQIVFTFETIRLEQTQPRNFNMNETGTEEKNGEAKRNNETVAPAFVQQVADFIQGLFGRVKVSEDQLQVNNSTLKRFAEFPEIPHRLPTGRYRYI